MQLLLAPIFPWNRQLLVYKGNKVLQCIQVSYDISEKKTRQRELNGLLLASRRTKCNNLLLLTDHHYEELEESGKKIKIMPVYEWAIVEN